MKSRVSLVVVAGVALLLCGIVWAQSGSVHKAQEPYTPTKLEWLAMELNAKYRIDKTDVQLCYIAISNNDKLMIHCAYSRSYDRRQLNAYVDNARKLISITAKSRGWDEWVQVEEQLKFLDEKDN